MGKIPGEGCGIRIADSTQIPKTWAVIQIYLCMKKPLFNTIILLASITALFGYGHPSFSPALVFSTVTIPHGQYGAPYNSQTLKVTGGKGPYSFSVSRGQLPSGMSLSGDGNLSGTPAAAGSYSFTVTAVDLSQPGGDSGKGSGNDGDSKGDKGGDPTSGKQDYTLVVDRASLTITANNAAIAYGAAIPTLTASYNGFVNGDNVSSLTRPPSISTPATSSSPAGIYPITVSDAADPNYNFTYKSGTLNISLAALVVTADAQQKEYGAPDPAFTYSASGFLNGDNAGIFTGSLSRTAGEHVGTYRITQGSLSAGSKYVISYTGNNLTIVKASQQITWKQSLSVGCSSTTQVSLSATASSGLPVTYSVSDGNIASVSGNVLTILNPGTAVVTATQSGDANHAPAQAVSDTLIYQPTSLISQHWSDVLFFDNSSGDYTAWQWYKNGQAVPGATDPYYSDTPVLNGQYYVVATNDNGRQVQTCTLTITAGADMPGGIKVYPNPAKAGGSVTVTANYPRAALQGAILQIIDMTGKLRQQVTAVQPTTIINAPTDTGIYIVNLVLAGGQKASINLLVE